MTIHNVTTERACAHTFARLDDSITVARTDDKVLLLNVPRDITELQQATGRRQSIVARLRDLF